MKYTLLSPECLKGRKGRSEADNGVKLPNRQFHTKNKKNKNQKKKKQEFTKHWPGVQIQLSLFTLSLSSNQLVQNLQKHYQISVDKIITQKKTV